MTTEQIVKSLRACGRNCCNDCVCFKEKIVCNVKNLEAADLIEQQKVRIKELEAKAPRWIPVTERLPEVHQNTRKSDAMLVYTRRKLFMVAVWNGIDWLAPMAFWDAWGDEIVYWMPLPEWPEEEI